MQASRPPQRLNLYALFDNIKPKSWPIGRNVLWFAIVLAIAFALPGLGYLAGLDLPGRKTLFILALAVGLWITEAIPPFATALLIVGFQVFVLGTGPNVADDLALEKYTRAWSSPVIWLLMGGFFLSLSMSLTGIDRLIFARVSPWLGNNARRFLLGILVTTAVLSLFISNTATTALILGILGPTIAHPEQNPNFRKSLLVGIPAAATVGGVGTLVSSTPNLIAYNFLLQHGIDFGFLPWLTIGAPILLILIPFVWGFSIFVFKLPNAPIVIGKVDGEEGDDHAPQGNTRRRDRRIVLWTFIVTVGLWITTPLHAISVAVASLVPIVVLTVTSVIKSRDIRLLPWDTLLLIMGGMSLGESLVDSGLAQFIITHSRIPTEHPLLMMLMVSYGSMFFSNFMSNTAAAAILIPLGGALVADYTLELTLIIALSGSLAMILPVSGPPNAIAYASGHLKSGDFAILGSALAVLGPPMVTILVWLVC